jgi:hypothetical protein
MSEAQQAAALVECLLRRPPHGTKVELDGTVYHFKPDQDGREVAVIHNPAHLGKLLSISEAYTLFGVASKEPDATALGLDAGANPVQITPEPAPAPEHAPAPAPEPEQAANTIVPQPAQGDAPKADPLDHDGDGKKGGSLAQGDEDDTPADLAGKSLDELRAVFQAEIGRKPNVNAKPETLIAQIKARRDELAGA